MRSFLREHQRVISFVGATIVLVTFLFREVVRDHLKGLADSLDQAQGVFSISGQLTTTNERLRWLQDHADFTLELKDLRRILKTGPTFDDEVSGINSTLEQDISAIRDLKATQASLDRLLRKLPAGTAPAEIAQYKEQLEQLRQERDAMETSMQPCANAEQPAPKCSQTLVDDLSKKSDALDVSVFLMGLHLRQVSASVLERAEEVLNCREAWFFWANVGSVLLFILGWSLGLLGNIYHVSGARPSEG